MQRTARLVLATLFLVGLAASVTEAQINPGRLSGTLVDEAGEPVGGVTLLLVPEDRGTAQPTKVKVKKNGRFNIAFLPAGSWKIETEDKSLFLLSMSYIHRSATGLKIDEKEARGHPTTGLPAVRVSVNGHAQVELVLAETGTREQLAGQLKLQEVSGPLKRSVAQYEAGEMREVVDSAGAILEKTPDLAEALYLRGSALWQLQRYEQAETDLRAAAAAKGDLPQVHGILGAALAEHAAQLNQNGEEDRAKSLFAEAVECIQKEIERTPDDPAFRVNLVVAMEGAGITDGLEEAYLAVLETDPSNDQVAMHLAGLYARTERSEEAAELIEKMGLKGRDSANTLYNIAVGLYNDGHNAEALAYVTKVFEADPAHAEAFSLVGYLQLADGDTEAALESFKKFVGLVSEERSETERGLIQALEAQKN